MEKVYSGEHVQYGKLPLPPISSLLSIKGRTSLAISTSPLPQCKKTPPPVKNKMTFPIATPPPVECSKSLSVSSPYAVKSDKLLTPPTAAKTTNKFPPMSSPPPPPHLLCGFGGIPTFQQSPVKGQPVGGVSMPGGIAQYLSGAFLDQSSMRTTNMPCGPNFQYQQNNFAEANTVACQTIIYQNTSIISPRAGFRSSICNHPSAWRSNATNFSSPETPISPRTNKMTSYNQSPWLQDALKSKDCRSRSFQGIVVDDSQFSCDDDVDQLREAGLDATNFSSNISSRSQQPMSASQSLHTDGTGQVNSIQIGGHSTSSANPKRPPVRRKKKSSQKLKDDRKYATKEDEKDGSANSKPSRKPIFPVCPALLADANKFSNSFGAAQHSDPNMSGFNVPESSEFNLFSFPKVDEIESVGSNDLGVDDAEYHPIALPLGCFQCNDSDTESDTTCRDGSLGRRMAKMGQDKFDLHLDKTLTFMDWNLIPIQQEPTNKWVSDDAGCSQPGDPRPQSSDKNRGVKVTDLTSSGSSFQELEIEQQEEHSLKGNNDVLYEKTSDVLYNDNKITMLDLELVVSGSQDDFRKGSEIKEKSHITENEQVTPGTENGKTNIGIEKKAVNSLETKDSRVSQAVKSPGGTVSPEAIVVFPSNEGSDLVLASTPDALPCGEVSTEIQSRRSSCSDTSDAVIGSHQDNPLARIATVLSQNMSKISKDKVGKNVERLSQNISSAMQKVKCTSENTTAATIGSSMQKHESCISDSISCTNTKTRIKEDTLIMTITTQCNESKVSTCENDGKTKVFEKKMIPPLWHDSKSCRDIHHDKVSSHEKRLLQESADFLGEDFSAVSRRSQRKRGVPKKLENYFSECGEASEDHFQTAVNKRKRQRTRKVSIDGNSTCDRTDNDSNRNMVYQDDVVERNNLAAVSGVETIRHQSTKTCDKVTQEEDPAIDEEFLLKSTPQCTRNMLKRLTSSLITRSTRRGTVLRSREAIPLGSGPTGVNTSPLIDDVTTTNSVTMANSDTDVTTSSLSIYPVTVETYSDPPTRGNVGDFTKPGTTASGNSGPVTQDCTVYITQEDTVKEGQSRTNWEIPCTDNLESTNISATGENETTHVLTTGKMESNDVSNTTRCRSKFKKQKFEKSESHLEVPAKKKKGRPKGRQFENLTSSKEAAVQSVTVDDMSGDTEKTKAAKMEERIKSVTVDDMSGDTGKTKAASIEEHETAIVTELKSTQTPEEITLSSSKPKKNKKWPKEITLSSICKPKKSKTGRKKKSDLPSHDGREEVMSVVTVEDVKQSADVKKKSKTKNVIDEHQEPFVGDAAKLKGTKKKPAGKNKTKEKVDVVSLSNSSAQSLKKNDILKQNKDGKETSRKKKKILENSNDTQKKKNNSKSKKVSGKMSSFQSKNLEKNISNLVMKNKTRILQGYAKFRVVTDPNQAAELMSNRPKECRFCKKTIAFSAWRDHEREHQFKCIQCCLLFTTKEEKDKHLFKQHKTSKQHVKAIQVPKTCELYHCMLCEKSFGGIKMLQRHLHSNIHGYNRHIQNRCLVMVGSHFEQSTRTLCAIDNGIQEGGTLCAIDNGVQEGEQLIQQQNTWCGAVSTTPKMWTLPENQTDVEELQKQFIKTVDPDENVINYYYREPEFLEWMKKQECILQKISALSNRDTHQRAEPYAVVTNFSMLNYLPSGPHCSNVKHVPGAEGGSTQCMQYSPAGGSTQCMHSSPPGGSTHGLHNSPVGGSTQCIHNSPPDGSTQCIHNNPSGGSTQYIHFDPAGGNTDFIPNNATGCSTNYMCNGSTGARTSFTSPSAPEIRSNFLPNDGSAGYPNSEPGNNPQIDYDTHQADSSKNVAQVGKPVTIGQSVVYDESALVSTQNNVDNSYQLSPDQPTPNNSRILSTSCSDHDHSDMDHEDQGGQMGWLSRAIQDIEADPYYQVPDFLDGQSELDNDSGFNELSTSQDFPVFRSTSTPSTSNEVDIRNYTDLDNGQQIQVCNEKGMETGANVSTGILPVKCRDSSQSLERSSTRGLGPSGSDTLSPSKVNSSKNCPESQINDIDDEEDPESQELLKLKYAQILCDIRNDVLGTRPYQD